MTDEEFAEWEKEEEQHKQEVIEQLYCELGDVMDCDDEAIIEQWAFELKLQEIKL